jgi:hypothetical protein
MISPNHDKIEKYNPHGFVFEDKLFFEDDYILNVLKLNDIKTIELVKYRDYKVNFFIIVCVFTFFFVSYFLLLGFINDLLFRSLILIPSLFFTLFYKSYINKLIIITYKNEIIVRRIAPANIKHAEEIFAKINAFLQNKKCEIMIS